MSDQQSKKLPARAVINYYWRHVLVYRRYVVGVSVLLPLTILTAQTIPPIILANVLNRLSRGDYVSHHLWASFGPELVLYAILQIVSSLILWRSVDYIVWRLEGRMQRDMAQEVFNHLTDQTADFHANTFGGSLVSQNSKLLSSYVRIQDTTIFGVLPLVLGLTFSVIVLARTAWLFSVILLVFALVYAASAVFVTKRVRQLGAEHAAQESIQTGALADAISNIMAIKSFAGRNYERKRYTDITNATFNGLIKLSIAHQKQMAFFSSALALIRGLALVVAAISVLDYKVNVAAVFLIFSYSSSIGEQLFQFSNAHLRNYNRAIGDASDMVAVLAAKPSIKDVTKPEKVRISRGDIRFDNVDFKHDGADDAIFEKLNLHIKPGEKVGLVGHSGSGKTTLTRVLLRFSDIQGGAIKLDGQNIAKIKQDDLHSHIAYVPQEPLLFHRSIAENISYGSQQASQQAIEGAAKMANAHEFVQTLPQGYDTLVGERGVKLSGGQRQRIAIARALLKNAPILVLDEATSALDSESEALIQTALWKLMEGRTAIVIAHRLSTIQRMDRIIVLDNGKVSEQGSHNELLKKGGLYAAFWARQSGGFIED